VKFTYKFTDKESFRSQKSSEFAELVLQSSGQVRRVLVKEFGLSISLVDDPIRIVHDGRKVGIGSFVTPKGEVSFSISPKEESIRLKALFQALGPDAAKSQVRFDRATATAPTTPQEDDFTPAFLLGLLEDISSFSKTQGSEPDLRQLRNLLATSNTANIYIECRGVRRGKAVYTI